MQRGNLAARWGFTLVELLVVISVIAVLAAIIFPVFASARAKARQTVCLSNLRQIGMALSQYAQDSDDLYAFGADPSDLHTNTWAGNPQFASTAATMRPLQDLLSPYTKSAEIWHCPSDTGYDELDINGIAGHPIPINPPARPTAYARYQTSYFYRTELALRHVLFSTAQAYEPTPPYTELGASELNVVMDANGSWHGGPLQHDKRYNVLMGDGHAMSQNIDQFYHTWSLRLQPGN